jgi:hypothetical protein
MHPKAIVTHLLKRLVELLARDCVLQRIVEGLKPLFCPFDVLVNDPPEESHERPEETRDNSVRREEFIHRYHSAGSQFSISGRLCGPLSQKALAIWMPKQAGYCYPSPTGISQTLKAMDATRMKTLVVLGSLFLVLSGCANLTPTQKKVAGAIAGVLVVGAIAAHRQDSGAPVAEASGGKGPTYPPACQMQKNC